MSNCRSAFVVLLACCTLGAVLSRRCAQPGKEWWKDTVIYEIYPQSFYDTDGDGYGDLKGIEAKVDYLKELGIGAVWLNPFNKSPMKDNGYDVSDFNAINPLYGTMEDFTSLIERLKQNCIMFIMDFVPNHTSDQHEWFQRSIKNEPGYKDYYIWMDANGYDSEGKPKPPNNWESMFGKGTPGSAWTWNEERKQFYLHQFMVEQPDLNLRFSEVTDQLKKSMAFWVDKGVMGFRMDAVPHLVEDAQFRDELPWDPKHTQNQPETYEIIRDFRNFLDKYEYEDIYERRDIFLTTEAYAPHEATMGFYGNLEKPGSHFPFNFLLLTNLDGETSAQNLNDTISKYLGSMDDNKFPNWVSGNHDWPRIPSRMGGYSSSGDILNTLALLLPGTATVYMGDELGMDSYWNLEKSECPDGARDDYRTPGRVPFQWNTEKNAGFTKPDSKPWIPVNPEFYRVNVQSEKALIGKSVMKPLSNFKKLVQLKSETAFKRGVVKTYALSDTVFAFTRQLKEDSYIYVILINLGRSFSKKINLHKAIPSTQSAFIFDVPMRSVNFIVEGCPDTADTYCWPELDQLEMPPKSVVIFKLLKFSNHEDSDDNAIWKPKVTEPTVKIGQKKSRINSRLTHSKICNCASP